MKRIIATAIMALAVSLAPVWAEVDGRISVVYPGAKSAEGKFLDKLFKETKPIEALAESFNRRFLLPRDILIVVGETGEINCCYVGSQHRVYISYDFLWFLTKLFRTIESENDARGDAMGAMFFVVLHEMGHALIGELDLPTTGREEDAADDFAVLTLNQMGKTGQVYAEAAAKLFHIMGSGKHAKDLLYWDEHSLDMQRFYSIFGMLYGCDSNRYQWISKFVPARTLSVHQGEHDYKQRSWKRLLAPHLRDKSANSLKI
jgi:hypothetical protein